VAKLAEALKSAGLQVWWDAEIETGSRFSADIERELDAADAVVVAWSASSVASTWVLDEAAAGRDRGRLLPVQLDGTPPPLGFRQFQSTDLADWKGRTTDPRLVALVGAICKMAGEGPGLAAVPALSLIHF
jgi:adenylate cyclase